MKEINKLLSTKLAIEKMKIKISIDNEWLETTGVLLMMPEYKNKVLNAKDTRERALKRLKMRYNNQVDSIIKTKYDERAI